MKTYIIISMQDGYRDIQFVISSRKKAVKQLEYIKNSISESTWYIGGKSSLIDEPFMKSTESIDGFYYEINGKRCFYDLIEKELNQLYGV